MIKKSLLLLSLVMCSCTHNFNNNNNKYIKDDNVYYNVDYSYDFDSHSYRVGFDISGEYTIKYVPMKNYYEIRVNGYFTIDNEPIYSEYFIKSNELFAYIK